MASLCALCGAPTRGAIAREQGERWTMEHGDCLSLMAALPAGSVDGIITDPPYGSGGDTVASRMRSAKDKYVSSDASYQSALPDIDGDALHPEHWTEIMRLWLHQCRRVLADGGVFATFIDWRNGPSLLRLVMGAGIRLRGMAVWDKGPSARPYRGGFKMQAEYIIWGGWESCRARISICPACCAIPHESTASGTSWKSRSRSCGRSCSAPGRADSSSTRSRAHPVRGWPRWRKDTATTAWNPWPSTTASPASGCGSAGMSNGSTLHPYQAAVGRNSKAYCAAWAAEHPAHYGLRPNAPYSLLMREVYGG